MELSEESSNQFLETLADWSIILKDCDVYDNEGTEAESKGGPYLSGPGCQP